MPTEAQWAVAHESLEKIFNIADTEGTGKLSKANMDEFATKINDVVCAGYSAETKEQGLQVYLDTVEHAMQTYDADGDGLLSFEECMNGMKENWDHGFYGCTEDEEMSELNYGVYKSQADKIISDLS